MSARLRAQPDLESACRTILDDIVALHGAEFGLIQLAVEDGSLVLVDQRGFDQLFVTSFRRVTKKDGTACARALRSGHAVLIEDVQTDKEFAPFRDLARKIGFRSVQSTPLVSSQGSLVGVVSTNFSHPHEPTPIEMQTLETYSGVAADYLLQKIGAAETTATAEVMYQKLLRQAPLN